MLFRSATTPAPAPAPAAAKEAAKTEGTAATGAPDAKDAKAAEGTKDAGAKTEAKPAEKSQADLEKEYRDRFAKLREAHSYEQKKLDVMQRELNLMQMQFYTDPNVALHEQTFRGEITKRTQDIDQQKASIEKAQKAIDDLEEELRKKGLPAGWAR